MATAKTKLGKGFGGALDYSLYGEKENVRFDEKGEKVLRGEIIGGTMAGESRRELMNQFAAVRELRPNVEKPVAHHILTFAKEDEAGLSNERMSRIASDYMRKKGYSEGAVWTAIKHEDTNHKHLHIIASTIEMTGKTVYLARTNDIKVCRELEKTHGLRELENTPKHERSPSRAEQGIRERGAVSMRGELQERINRVLEKRLTAQEFAASLHRQGVFVKPNLQKSGRVAGISFAKRDEAGTLRAFKGSDLGNGYKWSEIEKKIDYQPARDFAAFSEAKQEAEKAEKGLIQQPSATIGEERPAERRVGGEQIGDKQNGNKQNGSERIGSGRVGSEIEQTRTKPAVYEAERGGGDRFGESGDRGADALANANDSKRLSENSILDRVQAQGDSGSERASARAGNETRGNLDQERITGFGAEKAAQTERPKGVSKVVQAIKNALQYAYVIYNSMKQGRVQEPEMTKAQRLEKAEKFQMREDVAKLDRTASLRPTSAEEIKQTRAEALRLTKVPPPAQLKLTISRDKTPAASRLDESFRR